jgi:hypothetical protein
MRLVAAVFGTDTGVECRPDDGSRDIPGPRVGRTVTPGYTLPTVHALPIFGKRSRRGSR